MTLLLCLFGITILFLLTVVSAYQWLLAVVSLIPLKVPHRCVAKQQRVIILIPAHNEEVGLPSTLRSIQQVDYPEDCLQVIVIADRCMDATAFVAGKYGATTLERTTGEGAKGEAIAWAIQELKKNRMNYDAVMIMDADAIVHPQALNAFNDGLVVGHDIQQGYNYLSNPWESPFTRVIAVTSVLKNKLFFGGKSRLGLSGMLTGTGMCLRRDTIERHGWTAFSVGEDWEYSVHLLLAGEQIHFNESARVLAKESHDMSQASRQRLRWASGRHAVVTSSAKRLFLEGIRRRKVYLIDAAVTLMAPNYSTQASLAILSVGATWLLMTDPTWGILFLWSVGVLASLVIYFLLGALLTESPLRTLAGLPLIPLFLPWRMMIEMLGLLGYGRKEWGRSSRRPS